jgi:hypothetical protein
LVLGVFVGLPGKPEYLNTIEYYLKKPEYPIRKIVMNTPEKWGMNTFYEYLNTSRIHS